MGLVAALMGLLVAGGVSLAERARIVNTVRTLELLHNAVDEWRMISRRELTWWQPGDPPAQRDAADVRGDTADIFILTEILLRLDRADPARAILAQISDESMVRLNAGNYPDWVNTPTQRQQMDERFDGSLSVLDAWGTPIYATHPGRVWREGDYAPRDPDGTIRTYNEHKYGIAPNRRIVFVSAGPDRLFGLDEEFSDIFGSQRAEAMAEARQDNIYSIPVTHPSW